MLTPLEILSDGPIRVSLAKWRVVEEKKDGSKEKVLNEYTVVSKTLMVHSQEHHARFVREAEVIGKLNHPNIIPLLGKEDDALIYAYAEGVSLADYLKENTLSIPDAIDITCDILEALECVHTYDIIHCDVKPSNIILQSDDTRPQTHHALLNDFGFAKDLNLESITGQGVRLGTPNYMAPEQFAGKRDDLRSDIYAAGATLYHMVCDMPPYGEDVIPFLLGRPSFLKPLPREAEFLHEFIFQAIASDPRERFQSASEMLSTLQSLR